MSILKPLGLIAKAFSSGKNRDWLVQSEKFGGLMKIIKKHLSLGDICHTNVKNESEKNIW